MILKYKNRELQIEPETSLEVDLINRYKKAVLTFDLHGDNTPFLRIKNEDTKGD